MPAGDPGARRARLARRRRQLAWPGAAGARPPPAAGRRPVTPLPSQRPPGRRAGRRRRRGRAASPRPCPGCTTAGDGRCRRRRRPADPRRAASLVAGQVADASRPGRRARRRRRSSRCATASTAAGTAPDGHPPQAARPSPGRPTAAGRAPDADTGDGPRGRPTVLEASGGVLEEAATRASTAHPRGERGRPPVLAVRARPGAGADYPWPPSASGWASASWSAVGRSGGADDCSAIGCVAGPGSLVAALPGRSWSSRTSSGSPASSSPPAASRRPLLGAHRRSPLLIAAVSMSRLRSMLVGVVARSWRIAVAVVGLRAPGSRQPTIGPLRPGAAARTRRSPGSSGCCAPPCWDERAHAQRASATELSAQVDELSAGARPGPPRVTCRCVVDAARRAPTTSVRRAHRRRSTTRCSTCGCWSSRSVAVASRSPPARGAAGHGRGACGVGATQQSSAVAETTSTIEELAATAAQIAETAESVARYAAETLRHAEDGRVGGGRVGGGDGRDRRRGSTRSRLGRCRWARRARRSAGSSR